MIKLPADKEISQQIVDGDIHGWTIFAKKA